MKKLLFWNFILLCSLFAVFAGDAAGAAAAAPTAAQSADSLLMALIPVIVPLLVAFGKWAMPKVPLWILPILAPALGALVDYLSSLATGTVASPLIGAVLGSAGVGVREIFDQAKGRLKESAAARSVPLILLTFALPAATITVAATGCAYLRSAPPEAIAFHTFQDSWSLAKTAYDKWSERVVLGKVTQAQSDEVDAAWNKYRAGFRASLALARQDWSAMTPESLNILQADLLRLIARLNQ